MNTNDPGSKLVGHAVYMEFRLNSDHTFQMVVTPQYSVTTATGLTSDVLPVTYRRQLSTTHPKRTWRISSSRAVAFDGPMLDMAGRCESFNDTLLRLAARDWKLVAAPVVVECSEHDINDIRLAKTPYKLFNRIWKARAKSPGYPAEMIGPWSV